MHATAQHLHIALAAAFIGPDVASIAPSLACQTCMRSGLQDRSAARHAGGQQRQPSYCSAHARSEYDSHRRAAVHPAGCTYVAPQAGSIAEISMHARSSQPPVCVSCDRLRADGGSDEVTRSMAEVEEDEDVFYEGRGAPAELIISLLLGATLIYLVRSVNLIHCCSLQHSDSTDLHMRPGQLHSTCRCAGNAAADSAVDWEAPLDQL